MAIGRPRGGARSRRSGTGRREPRGGAEIAEKGESRKHQYYRQVKMLTHHGSALSASPRCNIEFRFPIIFTASQTQRRGDRGGAEPGEGNLAGARRSRRKVNPGSTNITGRSKCSRITAPRSPRLRDVISDFLTWPETGMALSNPSRYRFVAEYQPGYDGLPVGGKGLPHSTAAQAPRRMAKPFEWATRRSRVGTGVGAMRPGCRQSDEKAPSPFPGKPLKTRPRPGSPRLHQRAVGAAVPDAGDRTFRAGLVIM